MKRGEKIRSDYLTLAFSGAQKRAELLRNPCILGDPLSSLGWQVGTMFTLIHTRYVFCVTIVLGNIGRSDHLDYPGFRHS